MPFDYENCPAALQNQVNALTFSLHEFLGDNLIAVYLHGSLASGNFMMENSDIDLLGVVQTRLNPFKRLAIAQKMLLWNKTPAPVEISLLAQEHLTETPPLRCQFHFSPQWAARYQQFIEKKDASHWILKQDFEDPDIPAHIYLARHKSVALLGGRASDVLPKISDEEFLKSACADYRDFHWRTDDLTDCAYQILTFCRILAFKETRKIMSKQKAAQYVLPQLSQKRQALVNRALDYKFLRKPVKKFPPAALEDFKKDMFAKLEGFLT